MSQLEEQRAEVYVLLPDSQKALISASNLHLRENGTYFFPESFNSFIDSAPTAQTNNEPPDNYALAIPVIVEEAHISKEWRETGRVRVRKVVEENEKTVQEFLRQEHVTVERVPMDQLVDDIPAVRQEENTLIIPLVEEELVVVKRLRLKEEIRITKQTSEKPVTETVTLRKQDVVVERIEGHTEDKV